MLWSVSHFFQVYEKKKKKKKKCKKVEQKGRFTITEIISTPPASSRPFSPQEFMESLRETSQNVPKEADTPPDQMVCN
jgi:hypothetical protein